MNTSRTFPRLPGLAAQPVTLIGHPYASIGMGEQIRSYIGSCRAAEVDFNVLDLFGYASRGDASHAQLMDSAETSTPGTGIRVFHINGDEIDAAIEAFDKRGWSFEDGYNVIVPAWELPRYPATWAKKLKRFDEVWALSEFIGSSLRAAKIDSKHVGQALELRTGYFLPRRYFKLKESSFVILTFLDLSSYAARKNPDAVLSMFSKLRQQLPTADIQLVVKVKDAEQGAEAWAQDLKQRMPEVILIGKPLTTLETHSLINACDCFASLHRAEGFGRTPGEAMFLGRLAMATGWSGNLDYMTEENSLLIEHHLIPVGEQEYPHGQQQKWAEPSVEHAVELLRMAIDEPSHARAIAARGRQDVTHSHSFRAIGLNILQRITSIAGLTPSAGVRAKPPATETERAVKVQSFPRALGKRKATSVRGRKA